MEAVIAVSTRGMCSPCADIQVKMSCETLEASVSREREREVSTVVSMPGCLPLASGVDGAIELQVNVNCSYRSLSRFLNK